MEPQGWIVLGTKIDNKQLTRDLKKQRQMLEKHEEEAKNLMELKAQYEANVKPLEEEREQIEKTKKEYEALKEKIKEVESEREKIKQLPTESQRIEAYKENTPRYFELLKQRSAMYGDVMRSAFREEDITKEIEEQYKLIDGVNTQLKTNLETQHQIAGTIDEINTKAKLNEINSGISEISKGLTKTIKKVGRWALAIFGIRGAYMAVRNAINVISQGDEKLKADITYMKNVFAYALEPVVRKIVELAKQLLYYVGYIIKMWTGYDIFAIANKNMKKATGSAKELKKQLAGFDEMNVLSDNSGGGSGVTSNMSLADFEAPKWLKLIGKYGKILLPILTGIFGKLFNIRKLGILLALYGIYETIKNIIDFAHDPNFTSFVGILEGIATTVIGIGVAIGSWPAVIAGVIAYVIIQLVKHFDEIKGKFTDLRIWLKEHVLGWLEEHFGKFGLVIYSGILRIVTDIETLFDGIFGGIKQIIEGIVKIFKGDLIGGLTDILKGLYSIIIAPFKAWYNEIVGFIRSLLELFGILKEKQKSVGGGGAGSFSGGGSGGGRAKGGIFYPSKLPKLAVGGIINQPGRGVPYHGAIIGERGAEAVVPLTDSQQMALLGEVIGRYVNINATVPVYVGNRLVARELKRINAEDDFAYNR